MPRLHCYSFILLHTGGRKCNELVSNTGTAFIWSAILAQYGTMNSNCIIRLYSGRRQSTARIPDIANLTCIITRWRRQCLANFNSVRKSHRMSIRLVLQERTLVIRPAVAHGPKSVMVLRRRGGYDTRVTYALKSEIHKKHWTDERTNEQSHTKLEIPKKSMSAGFYRSLAVPRSRHHEAVPVAVPVRSSGRRLGGWLRRRWRWGCRRGSLGRGFSRGRLGGCGGRWCGSRSGCRFRSRSGCRFFLRRISAATAALLRVDGEETNENPERATHRNMRGWSQS